VQGPLGPPGPAGPIGPTGPTGPQGPIGDGIVFKGTVADQASLPATGNTVNDAYTTTNPAGHMWVWNGTTWVDIGNMQGPPGPAGSDPTTTLGDLIVRGATAAQRLAVGTNNFVLTADSTQTLGVAWKAVPATSQTPWISNIDGANYNLSNVGALGTSSLTMQGTVTANDSVNGQAGLTLDHSAIIRWFLGKNATTEGGSSAGSDFEIRRYDNTGTLLGTPVTILRTSGFIGLNQPSPAYRLDVAGDVNVTGVFRMNGTPLNFFGDPTTTKGDLIVHGATTTRLAVGSDGQTLLADSSQTLGVRWGSLVTGVSSFNTRTGAVLPAVGDYTAAQITNAVSTASTYADPAWITSLAWSKITGAPATVTSVFARSGAVVAATGDYTAAQVNNAVDTTQTYANPAWITSLAWSKITGAPAIVNTVFGRSGAVVAASGDYTAAQITNAVDITQAYANPPWITSLAYSKITGAPGQTPWLSDINAAGFRLLSTGNAGIGTANPLYRLDVRTPGSTATQMHIASTDTDAGGYLTSAGDNGVNFSAGGAYNGTTWIAKSTTATNIAQYGGFIQFFSDSSLTVGGAYTLTSRMIIAPSGQVGIGTANPLYRLDVRTPGTTQMHIAQTDTDAGGYLTSVGDNHCVLSAGVAYNGTTWVAKSTVASYVGLFNGGVQFAIDTGLTVGSGYTPTQRVVIDNGGQVGIGTVSPLYRLDVRTPGVTAAQVHIASTDTDAGFYLQTNGDSTGNLSAGEAYNGTNWIAKSTAASCIVQGGAWIYFNTDSGLTPGNAFTPTSRMVISPSGYVGIGINNPLNQLSIIPAANATTAAGATQFSIGEPTNNSAYRLTLGCFSDTQMKAVIQHQAGTLALGVLLLNPSGGAVGIGITAPGYQLQLGADSAAKPGTNTWIIVSDIRTKRNVRGLEGGLEIVNQLEPIVAEYNGKAHTPDGGRVVSFEPKQLREILPHAVSSTMGKLDPDDSEETEILGVNTHEILFHLILAVQQLNRHLQALEGRK
jgi:hypothetical protein